MLHRRRHGTSSDIPLLENIKREKGEIRNLRLGFCHNNSYRISGKVLKWFHYMLCSCCMGKMSLD